MKQNLLALLFDISLKVRILRAWQSAHASNMAKFDERQLLALEILSNFGEQTEASLGNTLGIASSSATELTKKLVKAGVVLQREDPNDQRVRILELTPEGKKVLEEIKQVSGARFEYLFGELKENELEPIEAVLRNVLKAAEKRLRLEVFNRYV